MTSVFPSILSEVSGLSQSSSNTAKMMAAAWKQRTVAALAVEVLQKTEEIPRV